MHEKGAIFAFSIENRRKKRGKATCEGTGAARSTEVVDAKVLSAPSNVDALSL